LGEALKLRDSCEGACFRVGKLVLQEFDKILPSDGRKVEGWIKLLFADMFDPSTLWCAMKAAHRISNAVARGAEVPNKLKIRLAVVEEVA
jgi:hypothetical protein